MKQNIDEIYKNIPPNTKLIIVTKGISVNIIENLIQDNHIYFAENKLQEAKSKWAFLKSKYPNVKLYMIGHLQTNKIKEAISLFNSIDTIDSYKLANKLAMKINHKSATELKIQVKFDDSPLRSGIAFHEANPFIDHCLHELKLNITGLMCIAPKNCNPEIYYQKLTTLAKSWNLKNISMGMSSDYKIAVECGATEIRVGSAIFQAIL